MKQPNRFRLSLALAGACIFVLTIIFAFSGARPTAAALTPAAAAPLVIDPVLQYLARTIAGERIAVDAAGNIYLALTTNTFSAEARDIQVLKLNAAGTQLIYNTTLSGGAADTLADLAVDAAGNAYLLCTSASANFPGAELVETDSFYTSSDSALSWNRAGRGLAGASFIARLLIDPANPALLYAATADNERLFKSMDGGKQWTLIAAQSFKWVSLLTITPGNPSTLYIGTREGVLSSTDGGASWRATGLRQQGVTALVFDSRNPATLYAQAAAGLYKSTDGGANWAAINTGLPRGFIPSLLTIDPANPGVLYVKMHGETAPDFYGRLYRSVNGGGSWELTASSSDRFLISLAVDPGNSLLYVGTSRGLFKSADGGRTLRPVGLTEIGVSSILLDPTNPAILYASTPDICCVGTPSTPLGGIHKSTDGGVTWIHLDNSLKKRPVTALALNPLLPGNLIAAVPDERAYSNSYVYALRLSGDGARPVFSIPIANGIGAALALDAGGNVYATGRGVLQSVRNGFLLSPKNNYYDGFAVRLNAQNREIDYSTYLGTATPRDLAVDSAGGLYLTGDINEDSLLVRNGFQTQRAGLSDVFLLKLDPQRIGDASLLYSSYLGGAGEDSVLGVAVDGAGAAYLVGYSTTAASFPTTTTRTFGQTGRIFLAKFDPSKAGAQSLLWVSRVEAQLGGFAVDAAGNAYLAGTTTASDFPVTPGAAQTSFAGGDCSYSACGCPLITGFCPLACPRIPVYAPCSDAFVSKVSPDGTALLYSTYFGSAASQQSELINSLALDAAGNVYLTGRSGLPATAGAYQTNGGDGFTAKLTLGARNPAVIVRSAANYTGPELARDSLVVGFLDAAGAGADKLQVLVRDSAGAEREARVFYAGTGQINFQIPPGAAAGPAVVYITNNGATIANGAVRIVDLAPGVFAANGNGRGVAAASVLYVRPDGSRLDAVAARYDAATRQFVAVPLDLSLGDIYLSLYGTGWRYRSPANDVTVKIGGADGQVTYAGVQPTLVGVDQINVKIPRTLAGRGEVDVIITVDGKAANTVRINFK